jgi:hypothetical protein
MNKGLVVLRIFLNDQEGGNVEANCTFLIKNNAPSITSFSLNNKTNERITFTQDENMIFSFSASDLENQVSFVKVALKYIENGQPKSINYTIQYTGVNTTITIRARDLPTGVYTAQAFVIDKDFDEASYTPIYQFYIVQSDDLGAISWLFLGVGIILGLSAGMVLMYLRYQKTGPVSKENLGETSKPVVKNTEPEKSETKPTSEIKYTPKIEDKTVTPTDKKKSKKNIPRKL